METRNTWWGVLGWLGERAAAQHPAGAGDIVGNAEDSTISHFASLSVFKLEEARKMELMSLRAAANF